MVVQRRQKQPALLAVPAADVREFTAESTESQVDLERLVPGRSHWELELGFGKGRYLLRRAEEDPEVGFLGIELVSRYFRMAARRASRRGLGNLVVARSEALYFLSACMPRRFARVAHVYFPDPWPKARHNKRRLFDANTVDLVLGAIEIGGTLCFATDFVEYGQVVHELLDRHPSVDVQQLDAWPEGPRTNYEAKYVIEGREILRLECRIKAETDEQLLHPAGRDAILVGPFREEEAPDAVVEAGEGTSSSN